MSQRKTKLTSALTAILMASSPSALLSQEERHIVGRSLGLQEKYIKAKIKGNQILEINDISKKEAKSSDNKVTDDSEKISLFLSL